MENDEDKNEEGGDKDKKTYKLYYFKGNCRGMISRAILTYCNAPFENVIIDKKQWPKMKKSDDKFEFGKLPLLEYKNEILTQAIPIQTYLAKKFKILGGNITQECKVLTLFETFEDMLYYTHEIMSPKDDTEESKKEYYEMLKKFIDKLEKYVSLYENDYVKNGNGNYFFGDNFSAADIFLCVVLSYYADVLQLENNIFTKGPNLWKLVIKLRDNELKTFFDKEYIQGTY